MLWFVFTLTVNHCALHDSKYLWVEFGFEQNKQIEDLKLNNQLFNQVLRNFTYKENNVATPMWKFIFFQVVWFPVKIKLVDKEV